jgi:hypothetical protein
MDDVFSHKTGEREVFFASLGYQPSFLYTFNWSIVNSPLDCAKSDGFFDFSLSISSPHSYLQRIYNTQNILIKYKVNLTPKIFFSKYILYINRHSHHGYKKDDGMCTCSDGLHCNIMQCSVRQCWFGRGRSSRQTPSHVRRVLQARVCKASNKVDSFSITLHWSITVLVNARRWVKYSRFFWIVLFCSDLGLHL